MNRLACRVMVAVAGMAVLGMTTTLAGAQTHPAPFALNDVTALWRSMQSLWNRADARGHLGSAKPQQPYHHHDRKTATGDARRLLARSGRPPIRGQTSSVSRQGLRGVGCLEQLPKPVCQQFDRLPQGAELPNPDDSDGSVQVKR